MLTWCLKTKRLLPSVRRKDKKFIFLIWCIQKKFRLQKVGVAAGFWVSKKNYFWFRAFLNFFSLLAPSLNEFFSQEGSLRIWINLVSHTLLVLVLCPPFISGATLHLTSFTFWPAVSWLVGPFQIDCPHFAGALWMQLQSIFTHSFWGKYRNYAIDSRPWKIVALKR